MSALVSMAGDATSQLLQLLVKDVGVRDFRPTGKGADDLRMIVCRCHNSELQNQQLWEMARALLNMTDNPNITIDGFRGAIATAVLQARSNMDLGAKK